MKHKHKHHHHHKKRTLTSSILHPTGSSLRSLGSNCSGVENFSTDDAEEAMISRTPPTPNMDPSVTTDNKDLSTSKLLNQSNRIIQKSFFFIKDEITIPLYKQFENKSENGSATQQQQHAAVQTTDVINKLTRPSKDLGRRSLFKGKTLAALMNERQKISLTRERRLSRTLGIIISVFLLCWLPFFVVYILSAFIDVSIYIKEPLPTLILWLGYINSACNPLIYTVFNVEFRTAFKRLLCPNSMNNSLNRNYGTRKSPK
jgi:hypothetical protein